MNAVVEKIPLPVSPSQQAVSLIQVIERAASDPSVDLDKMQRLLDMHERIVAKQAEAQFNEAMSTAQSEMGRISTDAENPQTRSRYASYGQLDRHLRPIYTKHGFALSFGTAKADQPEHVRVLCTVSHRAGFSREYHIDMPADGKGAKGGDVMTKTHATGAAATYGMRYLLKLIFNVAIGEDDTDGNEAIEPITVEQAADMRALLTEVGADEGKFLRYYKAKSIETFPAQGFKDAMSALERKRAR